MDKKVTASGFVYEISEEALDNWELLEKLSAMEENPACIVPAAHLLLGDTQVNALKEHVRDQRGRCSASAMIAEIMDIFSGSKEVKNF